MLENKDRAKIENNFSLHPILPGQTKRVDTLNVYGRTLAGIITECCPDSRERSLALTNLEQAIMWARESISRNETEKIPDRTA